MKTKLQDDFCRPRFGSTAVFKKEDDNEFILFNRYYFGKNHSCIIASGFSYQIIPQSSAVVREDGQRLFLRTTFPRYLVKQRSNVDIVR